ncbi:hypothetical protein LJR015_001186 [Peribacillus frigoritolerans]|uniref:hypothetical protein n=1 Tax=Peribacillus frigoritolerans TaxID=450367 RepID=UPI003ECD8C81
MKNKYLLWPKHYTDLNSIIVQYNRTLTFHDPTVTTGTAQLVNALFVVPLKLSTQTFA